MLMLTKRQWLPKPWMVIAFAVLLGVFLNGLHNLGKINDLVFWVLAAILFFATKRSVHSLRWLEQNGSVFTTHQNRAEES
jgi:hypothetical protein